MDQEENRREKKKQIHFSGSYVLATKREIRIKFIHNAKNPLFKILSERSLWSHHDVKL